jgi:hypothetical protein
MRVGIRWTGETWYCSQCKRTFSDQTKPGQNESPAGLHVLMPCWRTRLIRWVQNLLTRWVVWDSSTRRFRRRLRPGQVASMFQRDPWGRLEPRPDLPKGFDFKV